MDDIRPFLETIARLLILTSLGFALFRNKFAQDRLLKPLLWVCLNVILPIFFIHRFSYSWSPALNGGGTGAVPGWVLMLSFFLTSVAMLLTQGAIGWVAMKKAKLIETDHPKEMLTLFAISNCGFIPLPILEPIVPESVMVYMFFYILAFNLMLWTVVAPHIDRRAAEKPWFRRINMPLVGLISGLCIAILNLYQYIPAPIRTVAHISSNTCLDMYLVLLGAILAGIPSSNLRHYSEFKWHIILKLIAFPACMVIFAAFLPLSFLPNDLASAVRLVLVIEAAVPPATSLMVICQAFGTREQIDFMGSGIITTYLVTVVTIPAFVLIAAILYY